MTRHETIDEDRLAELEADFGTAGLVAVAEAFLEEAEEAVTGLGGMISAGADAARAARLHFLVGSARNLGATGFADLCKAHELDAAGFGADAHAALTKAFDDTRRRLAERLRLG